MRRHELCAINTLYKKRKSPSTYLSVLSKGSTEDAGQFVGQQVKVRWKKKEYLGKIADVSSSDSGKRLWTVRFSDGYVVKLTESEIAHRLVVEKPIMRGSQLDYIMVSQRWRSSVVDAGVRWGPSEHRNINGRADHGLVYGRWSWRLRSQKKRPAKDFSVLSKSTSTKNIQLRKQFDESIRQKVQELTDATTSNSLDIQYSNMSQSINHAIQTVLPNKEKGNFFSRGISERTRNLFEERTRRGRATKRKYTRQEQKDLQKKIKQSSLEDFLAWVDKNADDLEAANNVGDIKRMYKTVKSLSGKVNSKPDTDLNKDIKTGKTITDAKERATVWWRFLRDKFKATDREYARPEMPAIPPSNTANVMQDIEIEKAINSLKNGKAVGKDGIPVEVYKYSPAAKTLLMDLIKRIWQEESIPNDFGIAVFKMIYKRKGSPDDPSKYRCIGLLNAAYKVFSCIMLRRLVKETEGYLPDWQAGFRQDRGCRDNVMILRTVFNKMLQEGKELAVTFIDYSAAFDSVSHKFIDLALGEAGAKPRTRALFRAVYGSAAAVTKVKDVDGTYVFSDRFDVRRGVVQGDITSPFYFILAREAVLRRHDTTPGKGIDFGGTRLHTLGYADDAALLDTGVSTATARVNAISRGSRASADMNINVASEDGMHACATPGEGGVADYR